jgi:hypothetical protein
MSQFMRESSEPIQISIEKTRKYKKTNDANARPLIDWQVPCPRPIFGE